MSRSERLRLVVGFLALSLAAPVFADSPAAVSKAPVDDDDDARPAAATSAAPKGAATATAAPKLTPEELHKEWLEAKKQIFAGKYNKPDSEDPDTVNHLNWYEATGFVRPYPGEKTVRPPSDFKNRFAEGPGDKDD